MIWDHGPPPPPIATIEPFLFQSQPDNITCGPTSATMLLHWYGVDTDVDEIRRKARTDWFQLRGELIGMTSPDALAQSIASTGVSCRLNTGTDRQLRSAIASGRPAIVLVRTGRFLWHYVVVVGYTESAVLIADPAYGRRRRIDSETFSKCWNFECDLSGNDLSLSCTLCGGDGRHDMLPGPLGECVTCGGTGVIDDSMSFWLRSIDASPRTMIVPLYPPD